MKFANQKVTVIDGAAGSEKSDFFLRILSDVFKQSGAEVRVFSACDLKISNCIGCFGCWLETPGFCRFKEPAYLEIFKAWVQSDTVVLLTPVTFGGYSSQLKQIVERIVPALLPYMASCHGEIHHRPRYSKNPRLIGIGVQDKPNTDEAEIFQLLVGRHAIDIHAPSYAAEVIGVNGNAENLRRVFQSLLTRRDILRLGKSIKQLMPLGEVREVHSEPKRMQRALLIVGSPKTLSNSTSSVLGNYILDRIKEQGWETESLTLKTDLKTPEGEVSLLSAVDRADLLIFAFPLYVDALPYLMTRALELIGSHRQNNDQCRPLRLFAIANNGFPEAYQNNLALSICRNFAASTGITWLGSLALGAGESIIGGEALKQRSDLGFPLYKIHSALKRAADALTQNRPIPLEAIRNLAGSPIPYTPFFVWRFLFIRGSIGFWEKRASGFGVNRKHILAQPYSANPKVRRLEL